MAYTARDFHKDLAIFSAGGLLGPTRTRKLMAYAGRKGIQLAGLGARAALPAALPVVPAAVQSATPYAIGAGLGVAALQTQPGQDLLAAAEEHGRQSRILFERAQQEIMTTPQRLEAAFTSQPVSPTQVVPRIRKRAVSKFNKAVSAGMKIVKASTSYGKKGIIKNPKKAFAAVTKTVSKANKGKKISGRDIMSKVGRKAASILKKKGVKKRRAYGALGYL
jgi:hypothetical protein